MRKKIDLKKDFFSSLLCSADHAVTLWILTLWELNLYIVISGDLLDP